MTSYGVESQGKIVVLGVISFDTLLIKKTVIIVVFSMAK